MIRNFVLIFLNVFLCICVHSTDIKDHDRVFLDKLKKRKEFNPKIINSLVQHVVQNYGLFFTRAHDLTVFLNDLTALNNEGLAWRLENYMDEINLMFVEYDLLRKIYQDNLNLKENLATNDNYDALFFETHWENFDKFMLGFGKNNLSFLPSEDNSYTNQVLALDALIKSLITYNEVSNDKFGTWAAIVPKEADNFEEKIQISRDVKTANAKLYKQVARFFDFHLKLIREIKSERIKFNDLLVRCNPRTALQDEIDKALSQLKLKALDLLDLEQMEMKRQKIGQKKLRKSPNALERYQEDEKRELTRRAKAQRRERTDNLSSSDEIVCDGTKIMPSKRSHNNSRKIFRNSDKFSSSDSSLSPERKPSQAHAPQSNSESPEQSDNLLNITLAPTISKKRAEP